MGIAFWSLVIATIAVLITVFGLSLKGTGRFVSTEQGFTDFKAYTEERLESHEAAHNYHYEAGRKHEAQDQAHFKDTTVHTTAEERFWENKRFENIEKRFDKIDDRFDKIEQMIRDRD